MAIWCLFLCLISFGRSSPDMKQEDLFTFGHFLETFHWKNEKLRQKSKAITWIWAFWHKHKLTNSDTLSYSYNQAHKIVLIQGVQKNVLIKQNQTKIECCGDKFYHGYDITYIMLLFDLENLLSVWENLLSIANVT